MASLQQKFQIHLSWFADVYSRLLSEVNKISSAKKYSNFIQNVMSEVKMLLKYSETCTGSERELKLPISTRPLKDKWNNWIHCPVLHASKWMWHLEWWSNSYLLKLAALHLWFVTGIIHASVLCSRVPDNCRYRYPQKFWMFQSVGTLTGMITQNSSKLFNFFLTQSIIDTGMCLGAAVYSGTVLLACRSTSPGNNPSSALKTSK